MLLLLFLLLLLLFVCFFGGGSCKLCFTRCYLFVDHLDQSGSCPPFMIMLLAARAVVFCFIAGTLHVINDCSQYCLCRVYDFTPLHVGTACHKLCRCSVVCVCMRICVCVHVCVCERQKHICV